MDSRNRKGRPRLERRNAAKHIEYDAAAAASTTTFATSSSPSFDDLSLSRDLWDRTSFRIEGTEGEFDLICQSLGLSGPADFEIPRAAWEAMKVRSASDLLPRLSRSPAAESSREEVEQLKSPKLEQEKEQESELCARFSDAVRITDAATELTWDAPPNSAQLNTCTVVACSTEVGIKGARPPMSKPPPGIKGARPPMLKPPPSMTLPVIDATCSTWDLFRDFAPESERGSSGIITELANKGEEDEEEEEEEEESLLIAVSSASCSFTTNDDDSSSSTTEPMSNISPNVRFRRSITYWEKGELLGRGSFGSVYEGISDDGFFFAVKEVSLLDQGSQGRQSIYQLEQEIALLSQFEHENIVQYYGTDKDESKLYIFLELVTKGSLLKLYQRYHLRDSQVSAYTRQILRGLKYLHDRDVVHRDIKCANILVDASGSVKLADFGLAKATKLNDVKSCKGTAFWMAPEVVNRKNQGYGLPADIWSLGCTVLEMLTRQIPYSHLECMQALFCIGRGRPPPVPDSLSNDARDFILQCLQVNPADRPTAVQLLDHSFVKRRLSLSSGSASPYLVRRL